MVSSSAVSEIRECWKIYRHSLLTCNGSLALEILDSSTKNYYSAISRAAKNAYRSEIEKFSLIEKFFILSIRHRVPNELAIKMNGAALFSYGVTNGWIDAEEVRNTVIDQIEVFNNTAIAKGYVIGENEKSNFRFVKEDNDWKIDVSGVIPEGEQQMKETKLELDFKSEEKFIFYLLENGTSRKVADSIWIPINQMT